jgi:hypothetical protein
MRWLLVLSTTLAACSTVGDPSVSATSCPEEADPPAYDRDDWGRWQDEDGDCQDTRQEVLIRDSVVDVALDEKGCRVVSGRWIDPYDGREIADPSKVDVDHVVAIKDAHDSGAWGWPKDAKEAFTNDLQNLKATSQSTNRSKGARGPDEWLPPLESARCGYVDEWVALKEGHELGMSEGEYARVTYMMEICSQGLVPPPPQGR